MNLGINWGILGQAPDIGQSFQQGYGIAQRNALLMREQQLDEQRLAQSQQQAQRQARRDARQERQELTADMQRFIGTGARVIEQIQPQDDSGWQQVLATMQRLGFDVSEVPTRFDPNYAQQVVQAGRAISEHTGEQFTLSEGQVRYDSAGNVIARGEPRRRIIPVTQGGGVYIEDAGSSGSPGGGTFQTIPGDDEWEYEGGAGGSGAQAPFRGAASSDGGAVIRSLFPNARITDTRRPANSRLGRANPRSWHVRSGGAVDIAPIPGMSFDDYVRRIRAAGYPIIEARDEVNNPSSHATGPHWHVVIGQRGS